MRQGEAAVELRRADPRRFALLLERARHDHDLHALDVLEACEVVARRYRRLHCASLPQPRAPLPQPRAPLPQPRAPVPAAALRTAAAPPRTAAPRTAAAAPHTAAAAPPAQ